MATTDTIKDMMHVQFLNTAAFLLLQRVTRHPVWPRPVVTHPFISQGSELEGERGLRELCAEQSMESGPKSRPWNLGLHWGFPCYVALYLLI